MVQTRYGKDAPQTSQSQQQGGDGNLPVPPRVDNPIPPTTQRRGLVDSNYNETSTAAGDSQSELTKLRLENQAL